MAFRRAGALGGCFFLMHQGYWRGSTTTTSVSLEAAGAYQTATTTKTTKVPTTSATTITTTAIRTATTPTTAAVDAVHFSLLNDEGQLETLGVGKPAHISTKFFEGEILLRLVPTPKSPEESDDANFTGKDRLFEIQLQGKFKETINTLPPDLRLWGSLSVARPMSLGPITRFFTNTILAFSRALGGPVYVPSNIFADGTWANSPDPEAPQFAMPLWYFCDAMMGSSENEFPPELGSKIDGVTTKLDTVGDIDINTIYTLSMWSPYVDLTQWSCRVPGIGQVDLHRFWENMAIDIQLYALSSDKTRHTAKTRKDFLQFQLQHLSNLQPTDEEE